MIPDWIITLFANFPFVLGAVAVGVVAIGLLIWWWLR